MNWVESFYRQHDALTGFYTGGMTEEHRSKAKRINYFSGSSRKKILELGAGGGQSAAAAADLGHVVTAIELIPEFADRAKQFSTTRADNLRVLNADFYTINIEERFDVVCCWDSFGLGDDDEQRRLLKRIKTWLAPAGCVLLDVGTPWFWAKVVGRETMHGNILRRFGFDADSCRAEDEWFESGDNTASITQSLRCYSPQDLRLLLYGSGLEITRIESMGKIDIETGSYVANASLNEAMVYTAKIEHI